MTPWSSRRAEARHPRCRATRLTNDRTGHVPGAPQNRTPDDTTAGQARNGAIAICEMRGKLSERELINQFGDNPSAAVIVTRAEYHFCPEYR